MNLHKLSHNFFPAVWVLIASTCLAGADGKVFNIKSYGAVRDGTAIETKAVQKAIDACPGCPERAHIGRCRGIY